MGEERQGTIKSESVLARLSHSIFSLSALAFAFSFLYGSGLFSLPPLHLCCSSSLSRTHIHTVIPSLLPGPDSLLPLSPDPLSPSMPHSHLEKGLHELIASEKWDSAESSTSSGRRSTPPPLPNITIDTTPPEILVCLPLI